MNNNHTPDLNDTFAPAAATPVLHQGHVMTRETHVVQMAQQEMLKHALATHGVAYVYGTPG
jgi:hypothetical protein